MSEAKIEPQKRKGSERRKRERRKEVSSEIKTLSAGLLFHIRTEKKKAKSGSADGYLITPLRTSQRQKRIAEGGASSIDLLR